MAKKLTPNDIKQLREAEYNAIMEGKPEAIIDLQFALAKDLNITPKELEKQTKLKPT